MKRVHRKYLYQMEPFLCHYSSKIGGQLGGKSVGLKLKMIIELMSNFILI
jgi:hypothetical protein